MLEESPIGLKVRVEPEADMIKESIGGVLGEILGTAGSNKAEQERLLAQASEGATDLGKSGLVKRKGKKATNGAVETESSSAKAGIQTDVAGSGSGTGTGTGKGKRKVEFLDVGDDKESVMSTGSTSKKARVEDVEDSGV